MRKILLLVFIAMVTFTSSSFAQSEWKPKKPLRIVVPWGAGGSTDQLVRVLAGDLEEALGQKVVVVNQPGGAGAIGTKTALTAPKDGYTWTAGAAKDLGTYVVTGALDTHLKDWHMFLATVNYTVLSVNPDSKFKTIVDVVEAMKSDPRSVTIATGGINSSGGGASEALKAGVGGDYKMITYGGDNPAVMAAVAHETEITTQLVAQQFEMLRAKKLVPLAAFTRQPVTLPGIGVIPPITDTVPNIMAGPIFFGIWIPKGTPEDVIATMTKVWNNEIKNSKRLAGYALSKGLSVNIATGEDAYKQAFPSTQLFAWQLHDGGKSRAAPDSLGIPRLTVSPQE